MFPNIFFSVFRFMVTGEQLITMLHFIFLNREYHVVCRRTLGTRDRPSDFEAHEAVVFTYLRYDGVSRLFSLS